MVVGEAMVIAGIGCRKGVGAEDVLAAIAQALDHFSVPRPHLDGLATGEIKLDEGGIAEASATLGVPLRIISIAELKLADSRAVSSSEKSLELTGVGSVSEAAALAAAGPRAVLLGPRLAVGPVTCAIAISGDGK
ncbi:cobalt-precorrin 5A hydrolase [Mesorhizobium albiziae]|uniref:Cobalt-precorrin 5A hydrolase n=1 Tax=Neomesorhizobium albiziae TaxID=335020 RepID=A0A1I3WAR2_9HYPH|nr:cobalamin biosynthesis protein [Mesorhizobium albiziae]GLS31470.1 cobalamin biosynthesis protein CbiG [Mesorhizobium albiziae]SFK04329.1 cobalt-precorrin 5A hydrolase [Mesorhizobium albiziae]